MLPLCFEVAHTHTHLLTHTNTLRHTNSRTHTCMRAHARTRSRHVQTPAPVHITHAHPASLPVPLTDFLLSQSPSPPTGSDPSQATMLQHGLSPSLLRRQQRYQSARFQSRHTHGGPKPVFERDAEPTPASPEGEHN